MKRFLLLAATLTAAATLALGQQPHSQEEANALMAIQNATDANARIAAAKALLTDFKDTDYKEFANYMLMLSYQQLNDYDNMLLFGEQTLEINPSNPGVLLQLAYAIPYRVRDFDLDKEEQLAKAEDYANRALALIPNLPKADPNMSDDDWLATKKDFMGQANESLGVVALKRENYDDAIAFLQKATSMAPQPNAMTEFHLANAHFKAGHPAEALESINKSIALGGVPIGNGNAAQELKKQIEAAATN